MRFNCGLTHEESYQLAIKEAKEAVPKLKQWHDHFAILPVRVGSGDCRWLETVERRYPLARVAGVLTFNFDGHCILRGPVEYRSKDG